MLRSADLHPPIWTLLVLLGLFPLQEPAAAVVVEGAPVETKADPPCWPSSGDVNRFDRYIDCGNGTVLDTVTGLLWLRDADCLGAPPPRPLPGNRTWWDAQAFAAQLEEGLCGLTDGSQPGDWRLPSGVEWSATLERATELGCTDPALTNNPGDDCFDTGPTSFLNVQPMAYWSYQSAPTAVIFFVWFGPEEAFFASLQDGTLFLVSKSASAWIWPVRGTR